ALNYGLERACGEIVALLDADDLFLPGKLACLADIFASDQSLGMVYHKLQEWHAETDLRREWPFVEISGDIGNDPKQISLFLPEPTSGIAFRRSLLRPLLPIPGQIRMLADCFLVSLMPFLAPIRALPKLFTVYRIHGKNSYTAREPEASRGDKAKKYIMWKILIDAMMDWLTKNGYIRKNRAARVFRTLWQYNVEVLRTDSPGRLRFFLLVLRQNHAYAPLQTWKLTAFNYFFAPWSLILGSKRADRFYEWRGAFMASAQRASNSMMGMSRDSK
ncbi:MAG: glycosyltransferase, partial [Candidatus Acidiferrum sp.]